MLLHGTMKKKLPQLNKVRWLRKETGYGELHPLLHTSIG